MEILKVQLILGGARSGKSRFAQQYVIRNFAVPEHSEAQNILIILLITDNDLNDF